MAGTVTPVDDVAVAGTAVNFLPADAHRDRVVIQNVGAANMRIGVGFTPTATKGLQLGPGKTMAFEVEDGCRNTIWAIRETSTSTTATGFGVS